MKYIAIFVDGGYYWYWFEKSKVKEENGKFVGTDGWGYGGANTSITINSFLIKGRIESDTLQYR